MNQAKTQKQSWTAALFAYAKNAKGELVFSTVLSVVSILLGLVPFYCMYRVICLFAAQTVTKQAVVSWCGWALAAGAGFAGHLPGGTDLHDVHLRHQRQELCDL